MAQMSYFTILMSTYSKDDPIYLNEAIESIYALQELKPNQLVLVKDGPLTTQLEKIISNWKNQLGETLTTVSLPKNVGLAGALNEGLNYCKYDLVARMDSDDIALPNRFAKQYDFMINNPEISVSSCQIEEWNQDLTKKMADRKLPLNHDEIYKFAKSRNPISHPATIFRKSAVLESGGYPLVYPEDYALWGKLLTYGYKFANLPDTLLKMRIGDSISQRRGLKFLKGEIKVFKYLKQIGFINNYELCRNIIQRSIVRLAPNFVKVILYKKLR